MFNWVCPRCGKDVPPSKTECPYCVNQPPVGAPQVGAPPPGYPPQAYPPQGYAPPAAAWQPPAAPAASQPQAWQPPQQWAPPPPPPPPPAWQPQAAPPPPPPATYAPPVAYPPAPPAYPPPDYAGPQAAWPPQKQAPPAWLVGGGVAVALLVVLGVAYYMMQPSGGKSDAGADEKISATATPGEKGPSPLQKSVEVVGVRVVTVDKKPTARIVVVNHSLAEIAGLEATVTLWASTKRSEEDSVGTFQIKAASIAPNGSVEVSAPFTTKLKPYEMPDWQNLTADLQITSPKP